MMWVRRTRPSRGGSLMRLPGAHPTTGRPSCSARRPELPARERLTGVAIPSGSQGRPSPAGMRTASPRPASWGAGGTYMTARLGLVAGVVATLLFLSACGGGDGGPGVPPPPLKHPPRATTFIGQVSQAPAASEREGDLVLAAE